MTLYVRVLNGEITERNLPEPVGDQSKLADGKPRILPYEEKRPALKAGEAYGEKIETIQAKKVVATWLVRPLTGEEIASVVENKVRWIKDEAQRRILEIMPAYKQTNWLARKAELDLLHGPDPSDWPPADQAAIVSVLDGWNAIKAIREQSNAIEAALLSLTKPADIVGFDPNTAWAS